jgi:membrane carboxypeptidase/penicillin-binding protein PbpC
MGRADGTPVPGAFGGDLAAPVLFAGLRPHPMQAGQLTPSSHAAWARSAGVTGRRQAWHMALSPGTSPCPTETRWSNTKHSPCQRLASWAGTSSRYFRMPPLR